MNTTSILAEAERRLRSLSPEAASGQRLPGLPARTRGERGDR